MKLFLSICLFYAANALPNSTDVFALGVFSENNKIHFHDFFHAPLTRPIEYFSFVFGHSRAFLGTVQLLQDVSQIVIEREPAPDAVQHCDDLQSFFPAQLVIEVDRLPSLPLGNDAVGIDVLSHLNGELLVATEIMHQLFWTDEGIVASYVEVTAYEECEKLFAGSKAIKIDSFVAQVNESYYENRWETIERIFDFDATARGFTFVYAALSVGIVLSTGAWTVIWHWLRKDENLMNNPKIQIELGLRKSVTWKRIQKDVFRPPPCRYLFIVVICNGVFLLNATLAALVVVCVLPLFERSPKTDAFLATTVVLKSAFVQGVLAETLRKSYRLREDWRLWTIRKGCSKLIIRLPISFLLLCVASAHYSKWHRFDDDETTSHYATRVLVPMIALFSLTTLTVCFGSSFSLDLKAREGLEKRVLIDEVGGSLIPRATALQRRQALFVGVLIPFLVMLPPIWIHFKVFYGNLLLGVNHFQLAGLTAATFALSYLAYATFNIAEVYLQLHRGDWRWQWTAVQQNAMAALAVVIFFMLYFPLPDSETWPLVAILALHSALLLSALGFLSRWIFVRYIYLSLKGD